MWSYSNPVSIEFGRTAVDRLPGLIAGRAYALVTYPDRYFSDLAGAVAQQAGAPVLTVADVDPNPDYATLAGQAARFAETSRPVEVIVALGGGSVIDSAKVFAASRGDFVRVRQILEAGDAGRRLSPTPIVAVPTTAGTGSEVTCWATVWHAAAGKKYSLADPALYPETALIDPALMLGKSRELTLATGLDALSHALESIWNKNANPVSARHAVFASQQILATLPELLDNLSDLELRSKQAEASLAAGLAFSNTKTAIAHNLSYPITMGWGVAHGVACSFTLPAILRSVAEIGGFRQEALTAIFGPDLRAGADDLAEFMGRLGVGLRFQDHGVPAQDCGQIISDAFAGERGKNFAGTQQNFVAAAQALGTLEPEAAAIES